MVPLSVPNMAQAAGEMQNPTLGDAPPIWMTQVLLGVGLTYKNKTKTRTVNEPCSQHDLGVVPECSGSPAAVF